MAIALSGLTALGAEVVWTRLLSLLLGGTVYTFSIVLALFLVGLGIGSAVGSFVGRTERPWLALGVCQLLLAGHDSLGRLGAGRLAALLAARPRLAVSP